MDLLHSIAQAGSGGLWTEQSGLQWICCILSPIRAPEARAQNRLAGLAGWAGWLVGWLVDTKSPVTNHQPPTHRRPQSVCLDGHVEELPLEHVVHPIVPAVPEGHLYRSCCTYLQNFFRAAAPWNCW